MLGRGLKTDCYVAFFSINNQGDDGNMDFGW